MAADPGVPRRRYDFSTLSSDAFEELCFQLVRIEFPEAIRLAAPDAGLDVLLPSVNGGGARRGWQAKRFTSQISWGKCRESLEQAIANFDPRELTFVFARDLTANQHALFSKNLAAGWPGVRLDYWGASELTARLNEDGGRLVARRFFGDPAEDADRIARAVRAGGDMTATAHALERQGAIGEFLAAKDPFFYYQGSVGETDAPSPPSAPGTAIRVERIREGVTSRIDVQPRSADALAKHGPAGRLVFSDDEAGRRAFQNVAKLAGGGRVELQEGVSLAIDRLPPGLNDLLAEFSMPRSARVTIEGSGPHRWPVTLLAANDDGKPIEMPLVLEPLGSATPGKPVTVGDDFGGLEFSIVLTPPGSERRGSMNWRYSSSTAAAREQLAALRFLAAAHSGASVELRDGERVVARAGRLTEPLDPWLAQRLEVFEAIAALEEINDFKFAIPAEISRQDGTTLLHVAVMLREGGLEVSWRDFRLVVGPEGLKQVLEGGPIKVHEQMFVTVLGQEAYVGERQLEFSDYKLASQTAPDKDGNVEVLFVPTSGSAADIRMNVVPGSAKSTRDEPAAGADE
jgi:hypothetical protein